jgi:hypothetical protein
VILGVILLVLGAVLAIYSFSTLGFEKALWCEIAFATVFAVAGVLCILLL